MQNVIVSDTSCLILFYKIGELELLHKVFGRIIITEAVAKEFKKLIPHWIDIINPTTNLHIELQGFLGAGEATSISLAKEFKEALLIIDESKGRKVAKELGIAITGSLGVLLAAKNKDIISSLKPIIQRISATDFRFSEDLIKTVLQLAKED